MRIISGTIKLIYVLSDNDTQQKVSSRFLAWMRMCTIMIYLHFADRDISTTRNHFNILKNKNQGYEKTNSSKNVVLELSDISE